jgi:acyl-coenzyme A thioesterase PaaI-like protein
MSEILPVQTSHPNCFGCGQDNPSGLKLRFSREDERTVSTLFTPPGDWTGWGKVVHGGFLGLLVDEAMGWATWMLREKDVFVTRQMTTRCLKPVLVGKPVAIIGRVMDFEEKTIWTRGEIRTGDTTGQLLVEAGAEFRIVTRRAVAGQAFNAKVA